MKHLICPVCQVNYVREGYRTGKCPGCSRDRRVSREGLARPNSDLRERIVSGSYFSQ